MSESSRRHFLRNSSLAIAGIGAATVLPAATSADAAESSDPMHEGHFTVWVRDASSGEIVVQAGEREIVHRDPALARTLARIAAKA